MIDLYYAPTGNGLRAAIALEECGLAYNRRKVDLMKGEQKKPEFLAINPAGAIPVMIESDGPGGKPLTLTQSGAILMYAAEKSGKFIPTDPARRAATYQWLMHAMSDAACASGVIFQMTMVFPEKTPALQAFVEKRFLGMMRVCNGRLASNEYLAGELSVADLALYPVVAGRRALVEQAGDMQALLAWADRLAARPAVARGMQPPQ
jgi:GST-like protein